MSHSYRRVIAAAGGLLGCVAVGALFSLPVLLQRISQDTGWSVTGISMAMTIGFLVMAAASMVWGSHAGRVSGARQPHGIAERCPCRAAARGGCGCPR